MYVPLHEDTNDPREIDEECKFYKDNGIHISNSHLNKGKRRQCAVLEGKTAEEAKVLNRAMDTETKRVERSNNAKAEFGAMSLNKALEDGQDSTDKNMDVEAIVAYNIMLEHLYKEYAELTAEQQYMCKAIIEDIPERVAATELGIARSTYRDWRNKMLLLLRRRLEMYR